MGGHTAQSLEGRKEIYPIGFGRGEWISRQDGDPGIAGSIRLLTIATTGIGAWDPSLYELERAISNLVLPIRCGEAKWISAKVCKVGCTCTKSTMEGCQHVQ